MNKIGQMNRRQVIITIILFAIIFSMRLPHINHASSEIGDIWRQADTESIARNFVDHRFNIFYPQFNYDGPLPNYIQLEFQITTFLIAILYKIFGSHIFLARLVPTMLFMVSVYFLFKLIREIYSTKVAWLASLIYSILPITLFYSRAIMPESAVLLFFNGAFYYFYMWYRYDERPYLFLSAVFTALAISQKTPAVFIGLAMIFMAIDKYGLRFLKKWELWLFGVIALVPPVVYTIWSGTVAEFKFVSGIGIKHILPKFASSFLTAESLDFYKMSLPKSFTILFLVFALIGLFSLREKKERPLIYLTLAMILETVFIVSVIKFRYYLIFLAPLVAILASKALYMIFSRIRGGHVILGGILIFSSFSAIHYGWGDYEVAHSIVDFGQVIDDNTKPGDLIVIGTFDPARLSISNRQGWRANIDTYDHIPSDIKGEMDYFIENHADYFVVKDGFIHDDEDGDYLNYLEENFQYLEYDSGYKFYKLQDIAK